MRLLLIFIIFILRGFYTFGNDNCCEQCCKYLKNCCNKEKVQEEAKDLVNEYWLNSKKSIVLKIFNKDENENKNEYKNGDITIKLLKEKEGKTKITNLNEVKVKLRTNGQTWALFEITYEKKEGEEKKTKYLYCSDIGSINCYGIFNQCKQHISISVIACNTSNVTNMRNMFYICSSLQTLNLSNFNTEKVTNMRAMFYNCSNLTKLDLTNFNTSNVIYMNGMFENCNSLTELDLKNFDTTNVKNMQYMFHNCKKLTKLNLENFDTKNVTNMICMFYEDNSLKTLDLSNFNTSKVTYMRNMFDGCKALQTITSHNKNLDKKIIEKLKKLGFKDEPQNNKAEDKFVWTKNQ